MASLPEALGLERRGYPDAPRCQDSFRLLALGASVPEARRRVRARLWEWGLADEPRDDAAMVISEFFTNAVRHTASEAIRCELRLNGNLLHVEVADEGRGPTGPSQRDAGVDEEDGRGLLLVNALSQAWGVRPPASGHGRIVWAVLNCERASSPG